MEDLYTLEDLSRRLGDIPISTLKHRVHQLGLPAAARGSRNKLLFAPDALAVLEAADRLIKDGHAIHDVRRALRLADPGPSADAPALPEAAPAVAPVAPIALTAVVPAATEEAPAPADAGALDRLARALEHALAQLEAKDQHLGQIQQELGHAKEAAATFQQKTFYLQGELQRLQGELREARRTLSDLPPSPGVAPWKRLWRKEP